MNKLKTLISNTYILDLDAKIQEGDTQLLFVDGCGRRPDKYVVTTHTGDKVSKLHAICYDSYKIVAQLNPQLKDIPLFEVVQQWVNTDKIFGKPDDILSNDKGVSEGVAIGFELGYNHRLSENRFTTEHMLKMFRYAQEHTNVSQWAEDGWYFDHDETHIPDFLQSLLTADLDGKECEILMEDVKVGYVWDDITIDRPKLSPDGKLQIKVLC